MCSKHMCVAYATHRISWAAYHHLTCCNSHPFLTSLWWLRLKATLERTQRLAHSYTEQLLTVYPDRVQALGKGLAMDEERLKVSAESSGPGRGVGEEGRGGGAEGRQLHQLRYGAVR